jgi:GT2 family glycosyltransferase
MKSVFVSILNFNGQENTLECLRSLEKVNTKGINLTVLVIDNGSKEKLKIKTSEFKLNIEIIYNRDNLGFAGGHNVGISHAISKNADYIIILNNDVFIDKEFIYELVKSAKENPKAGIIAPKIYFAKGFEYHKGKYKDEDLGKVFWYAGGEMDWNNVIGHHRGVDEVDNGQYDKTEETEYASGCCMLVSRKTFEKVGGFDKNYFLYYEDSDLCQRIKAAGFKIIYEPKAVIWHKNAGSAGGSGSPLQDYYITRNRMLFGLKYAPLRAKVALIRESTKLLFHGRRWQKNGIKDFYSGKFEKGTYKAE